MGDTELAGECDTRVCSSLGFLVGVVLEFGLPRLWLSIERLGEASGVPRLAIPFERDEAGDMT